MSSFYQCLLVAGLCALAHCHLVPEIQTHHNHHSPEKDASRSKTLTYCKSALDDADVAFKYYHHLAAKAVNKNIFYSPVSVFIAFVMLSLGAESASLSCRFSELGLNPTQLSEQEKNEGVQDLLHMLNRPEAKLQMSIGNTIFTDNKVQELQKFLDEAEHLYQIFSTRSKTSAEAEDLTNSTNNAFDKIVDLIKDLDPEFVMIYLSYIFVNAYMKNPFYYQHIQEEDFFVDDVKTVKVKMMNKVGCYNTYSDEELSCEVVQIPYKSNAAALFILPENGKMRLTEEALGEDLFLKWQNSLVLRKMDLYLPKLSQSTDWDAEKMLRNIDRTDVFSDQSGIPRKAELKMSKAIQKAVLAVHEDAMLGQTGVQPIWLSVPLSPSSYNISFNRPFFVAVIDDDKILFLGKIVDPQEN